MEPRILAITLSMLALLLGYGVAVGSNFLNAQEEDVEERQPGDIITEIRSLLNKTMTEFQNQNVSGASALTEEAYLENYEFIEGPLAEQNETLMEETEVMLREQLRDLVKSDSTETDVRMLIDKINSNLDKADQLLINTTEGN
jgi:hypothetical protein